ncbi:MAG: serine hydrolase domain-containing protein, partial [Cyclobacteriaceae bacterium]
MSGKNIKLEILLLLMILSVATLVHAQKIDQQLDTYLTDQVQTQKMPGLTAAVVKDGKVLFTGAFGVRELGKKKLLTPEHIFHFASVSKPFVATAMVQLVEQGKVDLDDPITKYLPYFELSDERYLGITILQMLNHTSGMPDVKDYEWDKPQYDEGAAERYVRQLATEKMLWAPGTDWQYSNMAFDALGDVIAKVSGISFEEYIEKNILEPLGMDKSSFIYPDID